ncbi:hypothetical protein J6590_034627 [Homalodisca vitripennis]|nr:hypothetical protein J6590_034627 [Homalodisca vitripennis]
MYTQVGCKVPSDCQGPGQNAILKITATAMATYDWPRDYIRPWNNKPRLPSNLLIYAGIEEINPTVVAAQSSSRFMTSLRPRILTSAWILVSDHSSQTMGLDSTHCAVKEGLTANH